MSNKRIPTVPQFYVCGTFLLRVKLLQSCPTVCDPMDCSPPGSSVHGDSLLETCTYDTLEMVVTSLEMENGVGFRVQLHLKCFI